MNTQLFLEGNEVDLKDVITIPLNKSLEDLANPTNINNEFSKSIQLPVSINNNKLLGNIFRLDRTVIEKIGGNKNIGQYLNATKKIPFKLLNNGDLIMEGYAKLSLADYSADNRFYTLNLFGTLGDIFHKLLNLAFSLKYCPILDYSEVLKSENPKEKHEYAYAFDKMNNLVNSPDLNQLEEYTWKDGRYLMDDCLSGKKTVSAKDIKECWERNPELIAANRELELIKNHTNGDLDWNAVGVMPTHHGFPNEFDPKAKENISDEGQNVTIQFVDEANEKNGYDNSSLIGNGLKEEQLQQFISWQQKPYIYISALFGMFQKHMKDHPELFDGYELEIDPIWTAIDDNSGKIKNPYWSNLCYTLDFLFNQDIETRTSSYEVYLADDIYYKHISAGDDKEIAPDSNNPEKWNKHTPGNRENFKYGKTETIGLKTNLLINYRDEQPLTKINLNGYVCVALPCWTGESFSWRADYDTAYQDGYFTYDGPNRGSTNAPQLFFSHYFKRWNGEDLAKHICNGGYLVTVRVKDENDNVVYSIGNSWSPKFYDNIALYSDKQTRKLRNIDGFNYVTGQQFDILNEEDQKYAAVLLHRTFLADDVINDKLKYDNNSSNLQVNYYIGVGFPLMSFGDIPIGILNPKIEVEVQLMSERWEAKDDNAAFRIDDKFQYNIGCYTNYSSVGNEYQLSHCNLNSVLFPYVSDYTPQDARDNYITMFFQNYDADSMMIAKYGTSSNETTLDEWLKGDGHSNINEYGRYNTLVNSYAYYGVSQYPKVGIDAIIYDQYNDDIIFIGNIEDFMTPVIISNDFHSVSFKMSNLWNKEDSIFKALIEYSKMYGLMWNVDSVNKKLQLLTRLTYFDKYTIENWDDKIDYSKDFQITPILHASKYLNFDYDDENDATHYTMYGENHNVNYGGYKLKTGYEFTPDSEDLFKGIHSSCFSNRPLLTWKQILAYSPSNLPYVQASPFTMMDCDSKDETKPIVINNWVFRNDAVDVFSDEDINRDIFNVKPIIEGLQDYIFTIVDDTPIMKATQKYMYLDNGLKRNFSGLFAECTTFPNFNIVTPRGTNGFGCLFNTPVEDYTMPQVETVDYANGYRTERNRALISNLTNIGQKGIWIYNYAWSRWMNERYNINNKKLTCYVNLKPTEFANITPFGLDNTTYFSNFKTIDGQLFVLNKVFDFNPLDNNPTKCEFIQITDVNAYRDESLKDVFENTFTLRSDDDLYENGIYHIDKVPEYLPIDYMHVNPMEYYYNRLPVIVYADPKDGTKLTISDTNSAQFVDEYDDFKPTYRFEANQYNSHNEVQADLQLLPYYTWFINDGEGQEKTFTVRGVTDTGMRDSITFGYKNKRAYFFNPDGYSTSLIKTNCSGKLLDDSYLIRDEFNFALVNNTGLNVKTVYKSFYEIPILCTKRPEYGVPGVGISEVVNVILPTDNRCVEATVTRIEESPEYYEDEVEIISLPNYDCADSAWDTDRINCKGISDILDEIAEKYGYDRSLMKILPTSDEEYAYGDNDIPETYEGSLGRARLFTTVIHYLEGCNNDMFDNVSSTNYATEYGDGISAPAKEQATLYSGTAGKIHNGDFSLREMNFNSSVTPFMYGCGDRDRFDKIIGRNNEIENILKNQQGRTYNSTPIVSFNFYNNPSTVGVIYPRLGQSRIVDYYSVNDPAPYLVDYDIYGKDGYVYATFYRDILPYKKNSLYNYTLSVDAFSKEMTKTTDDKYYIANRAGFTVEASIYLVKMAVVNNWNNYYTYQDYSVEITTEYNKLPEQRPYETEENRPRFEVVDQVLGRFIIPENTTGFERYITYRIKWNNSLVYKDIVFYQTANA